jgi:hypothetical protein
MEFKDFLMFIVAGGGIVVASWVLERMSFFQALEAEQKQWVIFGVASVLSLTGYAVQTYVPAEVIAQIAPWFLGVSSIFSTLFLGQAFHKVDKITK